MSVKEMNVKIPEMEWQSSYFGISEEYSIELSINTVDTQNEESLFVLIDGDNTK